MNADDSTNKKYVLIAATLGSFLAPFMGSAVIVALPSIGAELEMGAVSLTWVATSYLLASTIFLVPFGRLADIYGRKKVFTTGIVLYTLATLLCALSYSATQLILFRVAQGMGSAMVFGTGVAILSSAFPVGERGSALGIHVAAIYLGLSLGPFIGGILTEHFGWRSLFAANVPLGLFVISLIVWKVKGEWATAKGETFDLTGSVIYGLMLVAVMYGFSLLPSIPGAGFVLLGLLALVAFIRWETRIESPVLDIELFRTSPIFAFSNLAALINYSATFGVSFLLSLYLQYIKGLSPQDAGLILVCQPVVQATFSPLAGRLSDKYEPRLMASAGMALTTVGLSGFALLSNETPLTFIIIGLVLFGFGFALFSSPNTNAVMSSVDKKSFGVASATLATMRQIGMMLSMGITMLLFALYIGRGEITPETHDLFLKSAKVAFTVFACLCFGGIFASLARGKVR